MDHEDEILGDSTPLSSGQNNKPEIQNKSQKSITSDSPPQKSDPIHQTVFNLSNKFNTVRASKHSNEKKPKEGGSEFSPLKRDLPSEDDTLGLAGAALEASKFKIKDKRNILSRTVGRIKKRTNTSQFDITNWEEDRKSLKEEKKEKEKKEKEEKKKEKEEKKKFKKDLKLQELSLNSASTSTGTTIADSMSLENFSIDPPKFLAPINPATNDQEMSKRHKIALEILVSERNYVSNLCLMLKLFCGPLLQSLEIHPTDPLVDKETIDLIFSDILMILKLNKAFLADLEQRMVNYDADTILGDVFCQFAVLFNVYSVYINKFETITEVVRDKRQKNSKFNKFLEDQTKHPELNLQKLEGFQIMPVQRVPRYELLFANYLSETPKDHVDHSKLTEAFDSIRSVAKHINDSKMLEENARMMLQVQTLIGSKYRIIQPHRKLIFSEPMKVKWIGSGPTTRLSSAHVYLFTDILLLTTKAKRRPHSKELSVLAFMELRDFLGISVLPPEEGTEICFGIKVTTNDNKVLHIYTADDIKRKKWIHYLLTTMNDAVQGADTFNKNSGFREKRREANKQLDEDEGSNSPKVDRLRRQTVS
eukprot:TRINITY_DN2242_c0_g2_i1.p1 TRINITY_DN2242_c0_g2~~TRINITY_DN2242_c0_g2_i1.p1  ORF type:complete len:653 (+),score=132.39 TRINITY_DN2242_c0_g2_i1:189-1961(+)